MPKGAKPAGIFGSLKLPLGVTCLYPVVPLGANTSTVPPRKLVAKRKTPELFTPKTRPLYTAPFLALGTVALLTAMTAWLAGLSPPVQADIVPSSVSKMKDAAFGGLVPGTRKPVVVLVVGFHAKPVGEAVVGQADPCPAVDGHGMMTGLAPPGILTIV